MTSTADKEGRPLVTELVPDEVRVFPVGRLDLNTTGLLILTNDGELSNKLMHPSHEFSKRYLVRAQGIVTRAEAAKLEKGIDIGIICVNRENAQKVADSLVSGGVKGIWNFAPIDLEIPEGIALESVHLSDSLHALSFMIKSMNEGRD